MAYYNANEPYNRQDSVFNGIAIGAGIGAAAVGGTHAISSRMANSKTVKNTAPLMLNAPGPNVPQGTVNLLNTINPDAYVGKTRADAYTVENKNPRMNKFNDKVFGNTGGWKGNLGKRALAYGGGILAGGLIGGIGDSMMD